MQASSTSPPSGPRIRGLVAPGRPQASSMAVMWLPWLAAPLFMAAPIGGCALAELWRPSSVRAAAEPEVRAEPMVPVAPVMPVMPVMPADGR